MPIYEYYCQECKKSFELIVSSHKTTENVRCTTCGGKKVTKAISAPSCHISSSPGLGGISSGCSSKSGFS